MAITPFAHETANDGFILAEGVAAALQSRCNGVGEDRT